MGRLAALVVASVLLAACASQSKRQEAELALMADWLPGRYDSGAQGLELSVVRVRVPRIGDHVYYVQETAAGDARRVLAQRLWSFDASPDDKGILHRIWSLTEPNRWREGVVNPDLFVSVMPQDFAQLAGCDVIWTKQGERFTGATDRTTCRVSSTATGSLVSWYLQMELGPTDFAMADQAYDMAGKLVQGRTDDPFYRFQKR